MDHRQTIEQALSEISLAEALVDQAKLRYYSARKKLEGLYSPASPEREKKAVLSKHAIAKLIAGRERTMLKKRSTKKQHI